MSLPCYMVSSPFILEWKRALRRPYIISLQVQLMVKPCAHPIARGLRRLLQRRHTLRRIWTVRFNYSPGRAGKSPGRACTRNDRERKSRQSMHAPWESRQRAQARMDWCGLASRLTRSGGLRRAPAKASATAPPGLSWREANQCRKYPPQPLRTSGAALMGSPQLCSRELA